MMKFVKIKTAHQGTTIELTITGELDQRVAASLKRDLDQFIEQGIQVIRIDLRGVSFVDSSAVKAMLCSMRSLRAQGGHLLLTRPSLSVRRIFSALGLDCFLIPAA